jgi:hypothetical protein
VRRAWPSADLPKQKDPTLGAVPTDLSSLRNMTAQGQTPEVTPQTPCPPPTFA